MAGNEHGPRPELETQLAVPDRRWPPSSVQEDVEDYGATHRGFPEPWTPEPWDLGSYVWGAIKKLILGKVYGI